MLIMISYSILQSITTDLQPWISADFVGDMTSKPVKMTAGAPSCGPQFRTAVRYGFQDQKDDQGNQKFADEPAALQAWKKL